MSCGDPGLTALGHPWYRCTMRNQPYPSAWKKGEMEQLKHLPGTTWYLSAPLQPSQPQWVSGCTKKVSCTSGELGGHPGRAGGDLPWPMLLCRSNTFLQQRRMDQSRCNRGGQ